MGLENAPKRQEGDQRSINSEASRAIGGTR